MTTQTEIRATCPAGVTFTPESIHFDADSISIWCDFFNCPSRGNQGCRCPHGQSGMAVFQYTPKT